MRSTVPRFSVEAAAPFFCGDFWDFWMTAEEMEREAGEVKVMIRDLFYFRDGIEGNDLFRVLRDA